MLFVILLKAHGPEIITHPTNESAAAPFSGVFKCSARGYGNLSIEWKRSDNLGVPVNSSHMEVFSAQQITTSTFIIPNVTKDDTGGYYCIAWIGMQASRSEKALLHYSGK